MNQVGGQAHAHHVNVIGDTADYISRLVAVKIAHRQGHQFIEHVPPQVLGHPPAHPGHTKVDQKAHEVAHQVGGQHHKGVAAHQVQINRAGPLGIARLNRTDGLPRKAWPHQVPHIAGDGAQ